VSVRRHATSRVDEPVVDLRDGQSCSRDEVALLLVTRVRIMQICLVPIAISTYIHLLLVNQEDHEVRSPWDTRTTVSLVLLLPLVDFLAFCGEIVAVKVEADSYGWHRTSTAGIYRTLSILCLVQTALVVVVVAFVVVVAVVPAQKVVLVDKMAVPAVGEDGDLEGTHSCVTKLKLGRWTLTVFDT